jgi:hypothetical protein
LPYDIKPFKDEVLCDISPLEVCEVILGQPYLCKFHVVYESRPRSVIITLGRQLHMIPKVASPISISLISSKKCSKVISQIGKFILFVIRDNSKNKVASTSVASTQSLSLQQKQVDRIVEEYRDIQTQAWPQIYQQDVDFATTYQLLGTDMTVTDFHIQDKLLCHLGHICVPTRESANMIWEAHYSWMGEHFGMEKTMVVLQKHFYWPKLRQYISKYIGSCTAYAISKPTIKNQGL